MSLQVNSLPCVAAWTLCDLMAFMLIRKYGLPFPPSLSAGSHFYPGCLGHPVFGNEWQEGYFVQGPLHSWYCFCGCYSWVAFSLKRNGKLKKKKKKHTFPSPQKNTHNSSKFIQSGFLCRNMEFLNVSACVCIVSEVILLIVLLFKQTKRCLHLYVCMAGNNACLLHKCGFAYNYTAMWFNTHELKSEVVKI